MIIEIKEMKFVAENKEKMEEFSTEEAVKEAVENAEAMAEENAVPSEEASAEIANESSEESSKEEKEGRHSNHLIWLHMPEKCLACMEVKKSGCALSATILLLV